ncbi:hypothetical protein BX666DRAFT_249857 [Dichotomocladium elegans]|nr:hypothetical protein BX666DRAFT_249857 [Dichotomocladium elegans]
MATISLMQDTSPDYSVLDNCYCSNSLTYRAIIARTTHAMDPMLHLLDKRAEAYAMIAQFERALDDACSLIRIAPNRPIGYLRAGLIFQMRGKSAVAINVYEEALCRVSRFSGSAIELQRRLAEATSQLKRRHDPFSRLPNELLISIFNQLSVDDLAQCIGVHKSWETWLQHHHFLKPFSRLQIDESSSEVVWDRFYATRRHIRSLKLADQTVFEASKILGLAMRPGNLENLSTLDIRYCALTPNTTLRLISSLHLTSLSIECDLLAVPTLEDILTSCPALLRLAYKATFRARMFPSEEDKRTIIPVASANQKISRRSIFRLQHLQVVGTTIVNSMIQFIYKRCPDLRELWTDIHFTSNLLDILRHVPKLQIFRINAATCISLSDEDDTNHNLTPSSEQQQQGLRVLEIKETDSVTIAEFAPLIEANAATLEELALTCSFSEEIARPFRTTFPRLSTLVLSRFDNRVQDVRAILEQCPALDSLTLYDRQHTRSMRSLITMPVVPTATYRSLLLPFAASS